MWDKTSPLGSDFISLGDDEIREMKTDIEDALSHEGTFPGATPSTPIFIPHLLRDTTANRPTGDSLVAGRIYNNTTLNIIERYNGSTWDPVAAGFASGTKMVFYQASAPTGWTAVSVNDKFLRVVTAGGTGGTDGGSVAASTSLAHTHTVDSHTHTGPSHTHSTPNHQHVLDSTLGVDLLAPLTVNTKGAASTNSDGADMGDISGGAGAGTSYRNNKNQTTSGGSGTTGAEGTGATGAATPGTDSKLGAFAYSDVIIATKD